LNATRTCWAEIASGTTAAADAVAVADADADAVADALAVALAVLAPVVALPFDDLSSQDAALAPATAMARQKTAELVPFLCIVPAYYSSHHVGIPTAPRAWRGVTARDGA
jgi:hypothetical protein